MKMLTKGRLADSEWWVEDKDYFQRGSEATVAQFYAALHMSAFGTKRTFLIASAMSAFGGKADIARMGLQRLLLTQSDIAIEI